MGIDIRELRQRWQGQDELVAEVVARLVAGRTLGGLELGLIDGRVDLRGMVLPLPERLRRYETMGWFVEELGDRITIQGVAWDSLDLTGAMLDFARFWGGSITNCLFNGGRYQNCAFVGTQLHSCVFDGADLRNAGIGSPSRGGTRWVGSSFVGADLSDVRSSKGSFVDCDFSGARIKGVDFGATNFVRCRFAGVLRDVTFWRSDTPGGAHLYNAMEDVDFADAVFERVEFRDLDLDRVVFPTDPQHVVIENYRCVLDSILAEVAGREELEARQVSAVLGDMRERSGSMQHRGVMRPADFENGRETGRVLAEYLHSLLTRHIGECA